MNTIHGLLEKNAKTYPDKEAFITSTKRLTYLEMNEKTNQLGRCLQQLGVKKGKKFAIVSRNNEHFLFAYFSLLKIGAIPMPLNNKLTPNEMSAILNNVDADGILFEEVFHSTVANTLMKWSSSYVLDIQTVMEKAGDFDPSDLNEPIKKHDICEILFTSGTTGVPKGVVFSHEKLLAVASSLSVEFNFSHDDKVLAMMPLSHSAPLNCFFIAPLSSGASFVIEDFTPQAFLQKIHDEKTTFTFAAPIAYLLAAKEKNVKNIDFSSMRIFAYGGSAIPLASYEFVSNIFQNNNFYQVYGLTESGPNGCMLRPHEHVNKNGSIGKKAVVNMEMKVVTESGLETVDGEYGEILLKGNSIMNGYYNNLKETAKTIKNGWLHTGDIAYRDEDGYIYVVDRKKDVIIPGGVNVYPREVEEVLAKHPSVYQVCVVGVPDEEWGETVKAVIVLHDNQDVTKDDLRQFVAKYLADYKQPRIYSFVQELPHNASGKILKQKVKEL